MYYIGIDIGTSSAKLTLIDALGKVIEEISQDYQITEPKAGWKEINPEVWVEAVEANMCILLKGIDTKEVGAIGVTGQMHTLVLLDKDGNVIRPALMWNDTRTKSLVKKMKQRIEERANIASLANIISTGSPASNLLWVKEHEQENFSKIHKFLIGPDYLVYRLTGNIQTDYCEASTSSLFDLEKRVWSSDMQELFDFPKAMYPEIKGTQEIAGVLTAHWVEKFHFHSDVKVLVGTGDNPAAAIATGCFMNRYPVLSIGTSGVMMYPRDAIHFESKGKNIVFSLDGRNQVILVQGAIQSAGNSMAWWTRKILGSNENKETDFPFDINKLGENTVLFYPHLSGDKTIYADPNLTGSFIGLQTSTTKEDMSIAVMEGIAMAIRQLCAEMKISKASLQGLRITGGGAKNALWMQIIADVLNVNVQQMESGSGAGYGMALVAASLCEENVDLDFFIRQSICIKNKYAPRAYNVQLYEKKYQQYVNIYEAMQLIFNT